MLRSQVYFILVKLLVPTPLPPRPITRSVVLEIIPQLSAGRLEREMDTLRCPKTKEVTNHVSGLQYFQD